MCDAQVDRADCSTELLISMDSVPEPAAQWKAGSSSLSRLLPTELRCNLLALGLFKITREPANFQTFVPLSAAGVREYHPNPLQSNMHYVST